MKNAVHGSSNVEKAVEVIKEFLPEVEVLPDGTVRGLKLVLFFFAQGCALAEPGGPWPLTFVLGRLENLCFFIEIICWAHWIS